MFESNFWIKGEDDIGLGDENELALSLSSVLGDFRSGRGDNDRCCMELADDWVCALGVRTRRGVVGGRGEAVTFLDEDDADP